MCVGYGELMHLSSEFEESIPSTCTQTTSRNLLLQTYICAAELVTCGVGPDVVHVYMYVHPK